MYLGLEFSTYVYSVEIRITSINKRFQSLIQNFRSIAGAKGGLWHPS